MRADTVTTFVILCDLCLPSGPFHIRFGSEESCAGSLRAAGSGEQGNCAEPHQLRVRLRGTGLPCRQGLRPRGLLAKDRAQLRSALKASCAPSEFSGQCALIKLRSLGKKYRFGGAQTLLST